MTIAHGKELIIKAGSIPAKYIKLVFTRKINKNIPKISVYGLDEEIIKENFEVGAEKYLLNASYKLTYG